MLAPRPATAAASALILLCALAAARPPWLVALDRHASVRGACCRGAALAVAHTADTSVLQTLLGLTLLALVLTRHWRPALLTLAIALCGTAARVLVHHLMARSGWSFPSARAASAALTAAVAIALALSLAERPWPRRVLIGLALAWAAAVGLSRVVLAPHWTFDLPAGWLLAFTVTSALLGLGRTLTVSAALRHSG